MVGKAGLGAADWAKSSFSSGGDNCVEVAFAHGVAGIRDSNLDGVQGSGLDRTV
ncbi:DUF397 domain-containing protein [Streptomyces sp. NPDC059118]|uniref:DUF397 domain-containing protein n=1 Tax=unclassified Streptomyces TaxID=2593676 RepID=UPI0036B6653F